MIYVIASIHIKDNQKAAALKVYETYLPKFNNEAGCHLYMPTVDIESDMATHLREDHIITVIEKWESMAAFKNHLSAPHVIQFREDMKDIIEKVSIKILKNAFADDNAQCA